MKTLLATFSILLLSFCFTGCTSSSQNVDADNNSISYNSTYTTYDGYSNVEHYEPMINYKKLADEAIKSIFKNNEIPKKLIVTDFVDLNSLKNMTSMGYILSNSVKNALINKKGVKVIEAELSKNFKISQNGLRVLTRDVKDIKSTNFNVENAIAGTYTYNEAELIVFIKLINLKEGTIIGSYTTSLPIGQSIINMLEK